MPQPQAIQKPVPPEKSALPEPVIKTMPEKYIGAPAGKPPIVREVVETKTQIVPPPAPPAVPAEKKAAPKSKRRIIVLGAAVVILAGFGAAAYVIFAPTKPAEPINVNTNTNTNANTLANTNANLPPINTNANVNVNANANANVNTPPPPPPNTGVDSDSDGLTDVEEGAIYGTNPFNTDSDNDTFNDGNEASHLYDPMKKAPGMLKDSSVLRTTSNATEGYNALVPAKWTATGENTGQFLVAAPTGEFFEVLSAEKPQSQSLVEWYLSMSPGTDATEVERVKTLQGYDALRSPDRLTTYVDAGNGRVFTLVYSFDGQSHLEFRTTYEALVGSFTLN